MNRIKLSLLDWSTSGFRRFRTINVNQKGKTGVDLEVFREDGSSTTLRVTIEANGDIQVTEPIPWRPK